MTKNNFDFTEYNNHFPSINSKRYQKANKIKLTLEHHIPDLKNSVVADLGCSNVVITGFLSSFVKFIYGFDIEISQIKQNIEPLADNCKFIQSDIIKIPLPSESVDVVICNHVYQWIENHDLLLKEINGVLKPNGYIYFSGPTRFALFGENKVYFAPFFPNKFRKFWIKISGSKNIYDLNYLTPLQICSLFKYHEKIIIFPFFLGLRFNSPNYFWNSIKILSFISPTAVYLFRKLY